MIAKQYTLPQSQLRLNVWERPGEGVPLLFVHATSFHGRIWDEVIDRLPGRHCYAPDMRGHGRSDAPAPPKEWYGFGEDVAALAQMLSLRGAVGIGHSMGGHSLALAATLAPECFGTLFLIDPTIQPRHLYGDKLFPEHFAARRRNRWSSPDEMVARFEDRPPFNSWDRAVLHDYCEYGLVPAPDGEGFVLGCPPEFEAAIYRSSRITNIYDAIATISIPVHIVRVGSLRPLEDFDMTASASAPDLAQAFPRSFDVHLPAYNHFLPMQNPSWVAAYISGLLQSLR